MKDIETMVQEDIRARQCTGMEKYGISVANNLLTRKQWLQHAYEESLDLAIYLRRLIEDEK